MHDIIVYRAYIQLLYLEFPSFRFFTLQANKSIDSIQQCALDFKTKIFNVLSALSLIIFATRNKSLSIYNKMHLILANKAQD